MGKMLARLKGSDLSIHKRFNKSILNKGTMVIHMFGSSKQRNLMLKTYAID